jgi:hypothetical protein
MSSLRSSIKFLLFVITYIGYGFLLYFAISLSLNKITTHRDDFENCRKLYVYSIAFLVMYTVDALRFIIYIILSILPLCTLAAQKCGNAIFIVNCLTFIYGVVLAVTVDTKDCLREYDINGFLIISGIGLIMSLLTCLYHKLPHLFESENTPTNEYYLMSDHV